VARHDERGQNLGTLSRLARLLEARGIPADDVCQVLKPIRDVRSARQHPAHALRTNVTDATLVHQQVDLLERVTDALNVLRTLWQQHPASADWTEPAYVSESMRAYRI
jgi:hypothetical protein